MNELPIGLSLILCDIVIEDIRSRKKSLIGLFSQINADSFPFTLTSFSVVVSMTGCIGSFPFILICEQNESHKQIVKTKCEINAKTPYDVIDIIVTFKELRFPIPGRYTFKVIVDGVPVMMRPFLVQQNAQKTNKSPEKDKQ